MLTVDASATTACTGDRVGPRSWSSNALVSGDTVRFDTGPRPSDWLVGPRRGHSRFTCDGKERPQVVLVPARPAGLAVRASAFDYLYFRYYYLFTMLSELIPKGRWKLLRALWLEGATGSAHALAKQNGMSYSNVHAELKRLERASLVRSTVAGNSVIFEAAKDHGLAPAIEALVRASDDARGSDECSSPHSVDVLATLASLGAPVRAETTPAVELAPEEAVAQGLRLTHCSPTLARAYPVLLARNRNRLNLERLKQRATALKEKQTLGFFLELTGALANDPQLRSFAHTLKDRRVSKVRDFFERPQGKYSRHLADQRTPQVARDWHFRMNMDMDNFRSFYSKFCDT